jgi:hypothetical protein
MTEPEQDVPTPAHPAPGAGQPTGPGATAGLPGQNSTADSEMADEDLAGTTLMGDVAPPGPSDAR